MLTVRIQAIDGTGTFTLPDFQPCRLLIPCSGDFSSGTRGLHQPLDVSLSPCCRFHPAEVRCRLGQISAPHAAFALRLRARPSDLGLSRPHLRLLSLLVISPRETLSMGFQDFGSFRSRHPAIRTTGLLTFAPAGLPPAEHTSVTGRNNRRSRFPEYGSPTGFTARPTAGQVGAGVLGTARRGPGGLHPT